MLPVLAWLHRWLGVATCLIFAAWFASGAVMLFQPFPSLPRGAQLALQAPVDMAAVPVTPEAALEMAGTPATGLRLVQRAGRPAYVAEAAGTWVAVDAQSGLPLPLLNPGEAAAEARRLLGERASISGPFDYDQWVVHNRFDPARPFFRLDANDDAGTQIYLSARSGELVQRTTAAARGWNWVGAVLHWVYFTPFRANWTAWDATVWWLSLVCLLVAFAGTILGVARMLAARRLRPARFSFFRQRWMRWHHLLGLGTAVFVLGWIFSGWLSMDHGRFFSRGTPTAFQAERFAGCPLATALRGVDMPALRAIAPAPQLSFSVLGCLPILTRYASDGIPTRLDSEGRPLDETVFRQRLRTAAAVAWPGSRSIQAAPVDPAATYALAEGWPESTLRVTLGTADMPDLYVDEENGRILTVMDRSRASYAWVYYAVHTFNVPGLTARPNLRKLVVLLPLTAGFLFSLTGVILGWRRARGATRRSTTST